MADDSPSTYHVDIWSEPPTYVCQLCIPADAFRGTVAEVTQHLTEVHQADAIPTPQIEVLLAMRQAAGPGDLLSPNAPPGPEGVAPSPAAADEGSAVP